MGDAGIVRRRGRRWACMCVAVLAGAGCGKTTEDGGASGSSGGARAATGGTSTATGGRASTTGGGPTCTSSSATAEPAPPVVVFLVDASDAMNAEVPNSPVTKYEATRAALTRAFTELEDGTGVGLTFYPDVASPSAAACFTRREAAVLARLDAAHRMELTGAVQAKAPAGARPLHDAYRFAVDQLSVSRLPGSKHVVLLTSGAATYSLDCIGDGKTAVALDPLVEAASAALRKYGIHTFVIGLPGSEAARLELSSLANRGATAPPECSVAGPGYCHFDLTGARDLPLALDSALQSIAQSTQGCTYSIPTKSGGILLDAVNVAFTPPGGAQVLVPTAQLPCSDGWTFTADLMHIELCSNTCAAVKAEPGTRVDVVLGCRGIEL